MKGDGELALLFWCGGGERGIPGGGRLFPSSKLIVMLVYAKEVGE